MGAVQILTHSMVQSIEENSVRKGYDPRDFALVAEGGAGPLFAAQIALEVGTPCGASCRTTRGDRGRARPARDGHGLRVRDHGLPARSRSSIRPRSKRRSPTSRSRARTQLEEDGIPADRLLIQRVADCRYLGQGYELRVDVAAGAIDDAWVEKVRGDFHDIHEREYSRRFEESDIEIPNVRVRGIGLMPKLEVPEVDAGELADDALRHEADAWFRVGGGLEAVARATTTARR